MTVAVSHHGFKAPEYQATFQIHYRNQGFIHVNKQGQRFCNETGREPTIRGATSRMLMTAFYKTSLSYPNIPTYGIFDEVTRRKGPLFRSDVAST